jgi:hypothetical protein
MGSPIRSEIWGYVFPGAPDLAAEYARMDATLDHTGQSVGAEMMLAAMASMAFFVPDVRRLTAMFIHYLPEDTPVERLTRAAFAAYDEGLSLRDARDRLMVLAGHPEACDAQVNVPFTFLGLLYGGNDLQETMLSALRCGYDTDCTLATAAALVGQILGASRIPASLRDAVGDELVMGIEYRRHEMTLTALARDTARIGLGLAEDLDTGIEFDGAPRVVPLPKGTEEPDRRLSVDYAGLPAAAPGEAVTVRVHVDGEVPDGSQLRVDGPTGWTIDPVAATVGSARRDVEVRLCAPQGGEEWPMRHVFIARLDTDPPVEYRFGVAGAGLYSLLGVYYDALPDESKPAQVMRRFQHHFVSLETSYLPEPDLDVEALYRTWSHKLGRPAVVASYENEVDPARLVGLRGPYCAYLSRTIISPDNRLAYLVIGNTDSYRVYLNGESVGDAEEYTWWTPYNNAHRVQLKAGRNHLLLKLLKRGDAMHFTLGLRHRGPDDRSHNVEDWMVDLSDEIPGL